MASTCSFRVSTGAFLVKATGAAGCCCMNRIVTTEPGSPLARDLGAEALIGQSGNKLGNLPEKQKLLFFPQVRFSPWLA